MYPPPVRWRNHTYRDLLSSSMDVFLSTVSNRLNVVKKQLAVIATIFLPLMFITGFWPELRLARQEHCRLAGVCHTRRGDRDRGCRDPGDFLQAPRLVLETR
jgi:CorA-like Mg2+ transporter protein